MRRLALAASLALALAGCEAPELVSKREAATTAVALRWCAKLGIKVTGIRCYAASGQVVTPCVVAAEDISPFKISCEVDGNCAIGFRLDEQVPQ